MKRSAWWTIMIFSAIGCDGANPKMGLLASPDVSTSGSAVDADAFDSPTWVGVAGADAPGVAPAPPAGRGTATRNVGLRLPPDAGERILSVERGVLSGEFGGVRVAGATALASARVEYWSDADVDVVFEAHALGARGAAMAYITIDNVDVILATLALDQSEGEAGVRMPEPAGSSSWASIIGCSGPALNDYHEDAPAIASEVALQLGPQNSDTFVVRADATFDGPNEHLHAEVRVSRVALQAALAEAGVF